jgi:NAD(P)-dependent dehydrogenase (short-subunit alcohol dehydrogenase family)
MQLRDKVVVVTGGGNGIGAALCYRFAAEGASDIVVADVDADAAKRVADEIGGLSVPTDVSVQSQVVRLVEQATSACGRIDLFCSNAGIETGGGASTPPTTSGGGSGASTSPRTCSPRGPCCRA